VVIVGAGFGGLETATLLRDVPVDVTVVDRNNFHTFQPLLYQVATSGLNAADVAYPVRGLLRRYPNAVFRRAEVTGVDWDTRQVLLDGDGALPFDYLVVAAGACTNYFGIPGAAEYGFPLYTLRDATRLRNHLLGRFEAAAARPGLVEEGALTFVVAGGGPTGVETAGAVAELIDAVLRKDFRGDLDVDHARVVLVEMGDSLLPAMRPGSRRHAAETLAGRRVELRLGTRVESVDATSVKLAAGEVLAAHTLVWAAGVQANPLATRLGVECGRGGRIRVAADLSVPGRPGMFAVGDIALVGGPAGHTLPGLAPVAMQGGRHVAGAIAACVAGRTPEPFRYRDKGTMATIGRAAAVAELPWGPRLWGTPGWLAWLGLHLWYVMGNRNRLSVFLNWAWSYLTWDRGPRVIFEPDQPSRPDPD
jgi:NADH:ubiquinone reductase (H+-translocating)